MSGLTLQLLITLHRAFWTCCDQVHRLMELARREPSRIDDGQGQGDRRESHYMYSYNSKVAGRAEGLRSSCIAIYGQNRNRMMADRYR